MSTNTPWPDPAVASLKLHWAGGLLTCSQIADNLWREHRFQVSRSAVIGKANRLGLSRSHTPMKPKPPRPQRSRKGGAPRLTVKRITNHGNRFDYVEVNKPLDLPIERIEDNLIPVGQRKTLLELTAFTCRWPIGEGKDLFFCGALSADGRVYCRYHCSVAYQPEPQRRPYIPMRRDAA